MRAASDAPFAGLSGCASIVFLTRTFYPPSKREKKRFVYSPDVTWLPHRRYPPLVPTWTSRFTLKRAEVRGAWAEAKSTDGGDGGSPYCLKKKTEGVLREGKSGLRRDNLGVSGSGACRVL